MAQSGDTMTVQLAEVTTFGTCTDCGATCQPLQDDICKRRCVTCRGHLLSTQRTCATSKGDTCMWHAPMMFHIVDDGVEIGIREVWADGTTVRVIDASNAVLR